MAANEANPDPNTSVIAVSAILLALVARGEDGEGQQVQIAMQVANAWANADDFLDYEGKPERSSVDAQHYGLHAGYRLYPTADDGWVFLTLTTDDEFERFCDVAGRPELATEDRFLTPAARLASDAELADELTTVLATDSATNWENRLAAAGVGCVRADGVESDLFVTQDPHMVDNGWSPAVDHERFGRVQRWGPVVTVDGLNPAYGTAPLAGQHTDALLEEFGHDATAIADLRSSRIVSSESA